ncbi:RCC1 domain-containing protein [Brevibacillus laterosporus]|uniref:RCC1 domain-containing protein n=1 Tax=Brevibacillus laterosporus TaxID=1465 RepID=UPI0018CE361A|nr:hypothetical protein [Brevibacillus laterosporus]MBG9790447.1 hypothetical protein [Brevibacillus laterosporus]
MANGYFTIYVAQNDTNVTVLGDNLYGQLAMGVNAGTNNPNTSPTRIVNNPLINIVKVVSGLGHSLFLTADGKLYSAGLNTVGQLGVPDNFGTNNYNYYPKFVMDDVVEIEAGSVTSFVIKSNGDLYGFGSGKSGQLGIGATEPTYTPKKLAEGVKAVSATNTNTMLIKGNGDLYGCGSNVYGNLALGHSKEILTWTLITTEVKQASLSFYNSYIVKKDGKAYACGLNTYGQMGNTDGVGSTNIKFERFVYVTDNVMSVFTVECTGYFHKNDFKLLGCGYSYFGQLGGGRTKDTYSSLVEVGEAKLVGGGARHLLIKSNSDGSLYGVGNSKNGALTTNNSVNPNFINVTKNVDTKVKTIINCVSKLIDFSEITMSSQLRKGPFKLVAKVDHLEGLKMQYKVLLNGVQKYPETGWTSLENNPLSIKETMPASYFNQGENMVTLVVRDSEGYAVLHPENVTLVNENPEVINPQLSAIEIHAEEVAFNATIIDADGDKVRYKVSLNGEQIPPYSGYTQFIKSPTNLSVTFNNSMLVIGKNTIKVDIEDEVGGIGTYTTEVTKLNNNPVITGTIKGSFLSAKITDEDADRIRYKMTLNNKQVIPVNGYTKLMNTPVVLNQSFHRTLINVGAENVLKIEAMDEVGGTFIKDIKFTGVHSGLLFCDAEETLYTTEIGELLKYLDFGDVISGQTTPAERVWVKNTLGFPVNDITITVDQGDFDGVNTRVEISRFDSPFDGKDSLAFSGLTNHDEKIDFYVRIVTKKKSNSSGKFNITVKAEPMIEQ